MSIATIRSEKREWNKYNRRIKALPKDYQFVYKQMLRYMFKTVDLSTDQMFKLISEIVDLFEDGARHNLHILEITGRDVASFCDSLTADYPSYMDEVQASIEASIQKALAKHK